MYYPQPAQVTINGRKHDFDKKDISYNEIMELAFGPILKRFHAEVTYHDRIEEVEGSLHFASTERIKVTRTLTISARFLRV